MFHSLVCPSYYTSIYFSTATAHSPQPNILEKKFKKKFFLFLLPRKSAPALHCVFSFTTKINNGLLILFKRRYKHIRSHLRFIIFKQGRIRSDLKELILDTQNLLLKGIERTTEQQQKKKMNTTVQPQQHVLKRQVNSSDGTKPEQYNYQEALSTVGMRVRQKIDQGYNIPFNAKNNPSLQSNIKEYAGLIVPQYRQTTAGVNFEPPLLVNQRTVSTSSSLEMFNDLENDVVCANGKRRNY